MFEKEAEEYAVNTRTQKEIEVLNTVHDWGQESLDPSERRLFEGIQDRERAREQGFKDGTEFGYNKANEWQYVSEKGIPQKEGHYLVCLRNKDKDIFDCWIYYDKDVGWYSMEVRMKDIYAWKEIVLPELPNESE